MAMRRLYRVQRIGGRDDPDARFFVLDYVHDPLARAAIADYASRLRARRYEALAERIGAFARTVREQHNFRGSPAPAFGEPPPPLVEDPVRAGAGEWANANIGVGGVVRRAPITSGVWKHEAD